MSEFSTELEKQVDTVHSSPVNRYLCERCGGTGIQVAGSYWNRDKNQYIRQEECRCQLCNGVGYLGETKT